MIGKLIDRDKEERTLAQVYSECRLGHTRVVAVCGPLGSGKTALLDSFARTAADAGATVLSATATSFERRQPLAIIDQLLRGCRHFAHGGTPDVHALMENVDGSGAPGEIAEISVPTLGVLHKAFQRLVGSSPLVICIDDAHFMDVESLQYLLALLRRIGNAPISVILAYCPDRGQEGVQRLIQAEILRMPNRTRLDVGPLSEAGVAMVLQDYFAPDVARLIAPECHRLSGGRPLLVHALAEDHADRMSEAPGPRQPVAGPAFGRAVLSCLYRAEAEVLEIAQAMATLGEFRSTAVVARLCGIDPESAARIAASPGVGGLLEQELLGQPSVREAVLGSMPQNERHAMRSSAARLLYHEGAPALMTAEHLMCIGETPTWGWRVLREAADQAVADGDHEAAVGYLARAHRECPGERERIEIAAKLADLVWAHNPTAAKCYLADLVAAAEQGELSVRQSVSVIRGLLWNGQVEQAARVMACLGAESPARAGVAGDLCAEQLRLWLPFTYPGIAPDPESEVVSPPEAGTSASAPELRAAAAFRAVLRGVRDQAAVPAAELVLREALAGAAGPASSFAALMVLIYSDDLDNASVWCDALLASTGRKHGLVWNALFLTARAEIHFRRGELATAKARAYAALGLMSREDWGAAIAVPLSLVVRAATAMGNLDEAESRLDVPVPSAAFQTLGGVLYLDARGQFHSRRGRHDAALQDFLAAGHLMKLWKSDCPAAVSWRVHAAAAYLHKGCVPQARELVTEQLALTSSGQVRTRGMGYRALAATLPVDERPPVLLEAATIFDRCGDSLNLAYTLADLSQACESLGDSAQGSRYAATAGALAERCAAVLSGGPAAGGGAEADGPGTAVAPAPRLSSAESLVAELAAGGSTNEQIARKLSITVSTVEQHLTRTYRKLGIRRRTQLPSCLSPRVPPSAIAGSDPA